MYNCVHCPAFSKKKNKNLEKKISFKAMNVWICVYLVCIYLDLLQKNRKIDLNSCKNM